MGVHIYKNRNYMIAFCLSQKKLLKWMFFYHNVHFLLSKVDPYFQISSLYVTFRYWILLLIYLHSNDTLSMGPKHGNQGNRRSVCRTFGTSVNKGKQNSPITSTSHLTGDVVFSECVCICVCVHVCICVFCSKKKR